MKRNDLFYRSTERTTHTASTLPASVFIHRFDRNLMRNNSFSGFGRHPMTSLSLAQRYLPAIFFFAVVTIAALIPQVRGQQGETRNSVTPADRIEKAQQFHLRAAEKTGLLIPLYIYPANVHTNKDFNRVIELKRQYSEVPFWVIVNPASGPGTSIDLNYTKAIDRLIGAGCIVLGYVPTSYGKVPVETVQANMKTWQRFYPGIQGIFFDEMLYEDTETAVEHQVTLNQSAHNLGFWPTVANPGTDTPGRYFAAESANVIVIHESEQWPTEEKLHGNYFGGYSDYPPFSRATLMYGQKQLNANDIRMAQKYTRWIYLTQDTYKPGDSDHPNPWDQLSEHLEELCRILSD
ncbi:MAG: hypothetical protein NT138_18390 [Planctomycetales bacterium]|nr:hypothetical protein [Planctomycetales bacterium]